MTPSVIPKPTEPKLISAVPRIESPKNCETAAKFAGDVSTRYAVAKFQPRRGVTDEIEVSPPETRDGGRKLLWQVQIANSFADAVAAGNKHAAVVEDVPVAFDLDFGGTAEQMVCALERRLMANHGHNIIEHQSGIGGRQRRLTVVLDPAHNETEVFMQAQNFGQALAGNSRVLHCEIASLNRLPASVAAGLMRNRLRSS
jgi:hypothetical protein